MQCPYSTKYPPDRAVVLATSFTVLIPILRTEVYNWVASTQMDTCVSQYLQGYMTFSSVWRGEPAKLMASEKEGQVQIF
jgi:hypothetical protein